MLLKLFVIATLGVIFVHASWKTCKDVEFCTKLRSREKAQQYTLDSLKPQIIDDTAVFEFHEINNDSNKYKLIINTLKNGQFRIQIEEAESIRYKIIDVLDGEPEHISFSNINTTNGICTLESGQQSLNVRESLDIELINAGESELIFKGDTLSFDADSTALTFGITFNKAKTAYGIAEHADRLSLQDTYPNGPDPYRMFNLDYFNWELNSTKNIYGAIPVLYGNCWPGKSSWIDFLNPEAREYYGSMYSYDNFAKSTPTLGGIWNDMNEPAVFDLYDDENTMPPNKVHYGGVRNGEIHNMYGFLHTKSTHQGLLARDNNQVRPFVLTRSHFAGTQRYSAFWTGDSAALWPYLPVSIAECLNANILGLVFCGGDIGGFNGDPERELVLRWYQAGAWTPFYRAHSEASTKRREPYLYDDEAQEIIRNAIKLRYKHIPIWYTLFFEHVRTGEPIIRPLFYQYPEDDNVLANDDHILVGTDILVRPVMWKEVNSISVYFPGGENEHWFAINDSGYRAYKGIGWQELQVDINSVPLFYRGGSVIVRKETSRPSTSLMKDDPFTIYVFCNSDGKGTGRLYVDDYTSFNYIDKKQYSYVVLTGDFSTKEVKYSQIDSDNEVLDDFAITIGYVWFAKLNTQQVPGEPSTYEMQSFTHMSDGKPLKDIKFNLNKSFNIQF